MKGDTMSYRWKMHSELLRCRFEFTIDEKEVMDQATNQIGKEIDWVKKEFN